MFRILIKKDNDFVLLKDLNGEIEWAHESALSWSPKNGQLVKVTYYINLYSKQIDSITEVNREDTILMLSNLNQSHLELQDWSTLNNTLQDVLKENGLIKHANKTLID